MDKTNISGISAFELNFARPQDKQNQKAKPNPYLGIAWFTEDAEQISEYDLKE